MPDRDYTKKEFGEYTLQIDKDNIIARYNKQNFEYRYKNILKYYDTIEAYVPVKYRSGLNLIKKFAALPYWGVQKISSTAQKYYITITGGFCELHNTGWNQVEDELLVANFHSMAGIGAALKTHDDICIERQEIYNLGFSFVAPLGADNYTICHKSFVLIL